MKEKILKVLDKQTDGFICPNQVDFKDDEIHEFFWAIDSLIEDGILRRRACDGVAYEYNEPLSYFAECVKKLYCEGYNETLIREIKSEFEGGQHEKSRTWNSLCRFD